MTTTLVLLGTLAGLLAATAGWLLVDRSATRRRLANAHAETDTQRQRADTAETALREREVENARLTEQITGFGKRLEEQKQALDEALARSREQAQNNFKALAAEVLQANTDQFLKLADQKLKSQQQQSVSDLELRKKAIEQLVSPIREALDKQAKAVTDIEKQREGAYHALRQQLTSMSETQQALRDETGNLVKALRRPEVRGRWGEIQLRRVAELAGMIDHCDFEEQPTFDHEAGGKLRPDMAIALPGGRRIVVDAKTPLDAYISALEAPDENTRNAELDRHASQIMAQVDNLKSKSYQALFERSPDFVVLFIPSEAFLEPALRRKPTLIEDALGKGIVIATPGTLVALLKAVAIGWREEKLAESARQIADHGRELHKRITTAIAHLADLGKRIDATINSYNKLVGSIDRQVLPQARRFEELGAESDKKLPPEGELRQIESAVRGVD
ncbi:DNA recombination protein RmuC [Mucisphaera calidilacus]|uniref:DNA recombination protein RmuC n=1 Tax=Mucisphaera calidilacus TaxID=2527982 RepID=A0A518BTT5_9BACT|nr:DNA recombination protein RmuC [Mucisphaera calidilacus]QDU70391.1 DNA recombination protein RmuC [Mucisphaera calidilacus]